MDKRISPLFLRPGPGIGGSCFPKDSIALSKMGKKLGLDLKIIDASVESNITRKNSLAERVIKLSQEKNLEGKTVSLLGLTFKANTDDTRYSPALNLVEEFSRQIRMILGILLRLIWLRNFLKKMLKFMLMTHMGLKSLNLWLIRKL